MRKTTFRLGGVLLAGLLVLAYGARVWAMDALVTRVVDGDSFEIRPTDGISTIRLYGIDSPEYGQNSWHEARALARKLIEDKTVLIQPVDKDPYGRTVALVWYRGQLINEVMVRSGMAWMYPHFCQSQPLCDTLARQEAMAKKERLGIWREQQPSPPWTWKRRH